MTRNGQINKAALEFVSAMCKHCDINADCNNADGYCTEHDSQECGFAAGAQWADEHPNLESLWHDASEEPKKYPIICQDELDNVWIQYSLKDYVDGWNEFFQCECITRWAYVTDLLPKGGKR